jgi:hypothetical protein
VPRLIPAAIAALALVAPAAAAAQTTSASPNMSLVANVPYVEGASSSGSDIEFAELKGRTYALAGTLSRGLQVFDITERAVPVKVAVYDCLITQGDTQVFRQDDLPGRTFVTYTADSTPSAQRTADSACYQDAEALGFDAIADDGRGRQGTFIAEITDPTRPATVSFVPFPKGSHNQTVHPSGNFLYNSNSELITNIASSAIEIFDISDLAKPVQLPSYELLKVPASLGNDSHDITFSADGRRAYSAALSHEEIIDTTDPAKPRRVGTIVDPTVNVWHQSDPITVGDRTYLVVEDEVAGATPTNQCPNGGVHVWDITGPLEAAPVKVGYWNISDAGGAAGSCTAHVFRLYPEQKKMTIAYYNGGVRVVDLGGLAGVGVGTTGVNGLEEVGHLRLPSSNSWAAKTPSFEADGSFFLYSNDLNRGLDVIRYDASAAASSTPGTWLPPKEAAKVLRGARRTSAGDQLVCLLPR